MLLFYWMTRLIFDNTPITIWNSNLILNFDFRPHLTKQQWTNLNNTWHTTSTQQCFINKMMMVMGLENYFYAKCLSDQGFKIEDLKKHNVNAGLADMRKLLTMISISMISQIESVCHVPSLMQAMYVKKFKFRILMRCHC